MTVLGDAIGALRDVVLMQERISVLNGKVDRLADDVGGLNTYIVAIDKRLVRIEAMIEIATRVPVDTPRLAEGNRE